MRDTTHLPTGWLTLLLVGSLLMATFSPFVVAQSETFTAEVLTYDGQVAVEDGVVTVRGTAPSDDEVAVVFVDGRGGTVAAALPVAGDRFGEVIELSDGDGRLSEGVVDVFVFSVGADEVFGTGGEGPDSVDDLVAFADDLEQQGLTTRQLHERLLLETVDDDASDDRVDQTTFLLTRGTVRITDVVPRADRDATGVNAIPAGATMVVRGTTNRRPNGVFVTVEVRDGPDADRFDVGTDDDWESDGMWAVEIPVPEDVEPGTYSLRVEAGDRSATTPVEIVEAGTTETPTDPTDEPSTTTPTVTSERETETTRDATSEATPEPTPEPTSAQTATDSPGFGVITALVAALVAFVVFVGYGRRRY